MDNRSPEFMNEHSTIDREDMLMPEIIRELRQVGGLASRKQIIKELKENSDKIPEDYIDYETKSERTGNTYSPFMYQYNYAIKNLLYAGFLTVPERGKIKLTEKGRISNLESFDAKEMVRKISQPMFDEKSKSNAKKKNEIPEKIDIQVSKEDIDISTNSQEDDWKGKLLDSLKNMSPQKFEMFARSLVNAMGVDIDKEKGVQYTGDGGIDGYGYITSGDFRTARVAIQAKRWTGNVSSPEIDKFRGAMDKFNAEYGIFITTSEFTRDAIHASRVGTRVITLINGDKIADLVAENELYVTPVKTYILDDFYLEKD